MKSQPNPLTFESPLDNKEIRPVNPKRSQPWIFIGRTDAEIEAPTLWPPDVKSWLIGKDPGAGKNWGQEEKGTTEDEMIGWHHWLNGHEFEETQGDSDGQRNLACCSSWGHKDWTWLNNWTTAAIHWGTWQGYVKSMLMPVADFIRGEIF